MSRGNSTPFDGDELAAWHGLLQTHRRVVRELDQQLSATHRISVSEFDVLITLDNSPDRALRMSDLATAVMLSNSGLTRLVARLETQGLVERLADPDDGRSFRAALTPAGARRLAEARGTHNAVIRALFLDRLSSAQRKALGRSWQQALRPA